MAMFKVGQRVKCIASFVPNGQRGRFFYSDKMVGHEGTIVRRAPEEGWVVDFPSFPGPITHLEGATEWIVLECEIVPLTDPAADAFIASIKSLRPYEEPLRTLTEREMDKIGGAS